MGLVSGTKPRPYILNQQGNGAILQRQFQPNLLSLGMPLDIGEPFLGHPVKRQPVGFG